jgi:Fe2+ transport system protein FeoA
MNLAELPRGSVAHVLRLGGRGSFRRRLMELGLLPGTRIEVIGSAPLGDPLELLVRGSSLSIRRSEALTVDVTPLSESESVKARTAAAHVTPLSESESVKARTAAAHEARSMAGSGAAEGTP